MKKLLISLLIVLIIFPLITQSVSAQDNKYAVIWGSGGFKGEQICGDNNARLMAHLLVHEYGYSNIKILINKRFTYANAVESLDWLRQNTDENSTIVLFYSGHGTMNGVGMFSHYYLNYLFHDIKYGRLCMILECCYSGNAVESLSGENRLIIGSTKINQTGQTSASGSIFGYYFLKEAIKGGLADLNGDGVSMQEAFYYYYNKNPYLFGTISDNTGEFIP